jgi:hypothetical protein
MKDDNDGRSLAGWADVIRRSGEQAREQSREIAVSPDYSALADRVSKLERQVRQLIDELDRVRLAADEAGNVAAIARNTAESHHHYASDLYS